MRRLILALLLVLVASPAWGAAAHVQHKKNDSPAGTDSDTTIAATFDAAVTSGGLVAGCVTNKQDEATVSSVTDDKSNSYTVQQTILQNNVRLTNFWAKNLTNAPSIVTVTFSATTQYRSLIIHEASGLDASSPLDQADNGNAQVSPGTGTDAVTSDTVTTTTNGQYIFGCSAISSTFPASAQYTAGTGFTESTESTPGGAKPDLVAEYQVQSSFGNIAATFTLANDNATVTEIMTFKAATAATTPRRRVIRWQ